MNITSISLFKPIPSLLLLIFLELFDIVKCCFCSNCCATFDDDDDEITSIGWSVCKCTTCLYGDLALAKYILIADLLFSDRDAILSNNRSIQ
ncbi:unnamed protein product [Schistosoma mattheei]|uniref:Secreted protein n=1 Tax=Schistosoma mattheei TaxID=31246 RepID=A0A3P7Z020_9TREM|nr:unnamed protein product [Schistosoma mattheei]